MKAGMFFPASLALALVLAGCSATPPAPPDTRNADAKTIRDAEAAWSQALASRDVDRITSFYTDDASLFVADVPVVTGKSNIVSLFKKSLADKNFTLSFSVNKVVVSKSSDMAYTQGVYTMTRTIPKTKKVVSEKGKYVTVYMKQANGSWKAVADISNADGPQVPVKPAKAAKPAKPAKAAKAKRHR